MDGFYFIDGADRLRAFLFPMARPPPRGHRSSCPVAFQDVCYICVVRVLRAHTAGLSWTLLHNMLHETGSLPGKWGRGAGFQSIFLAAACSGRVDLLPISPTHPTLHTWGVSLAGNCICGAVSFNYLHYDIHLHVRSFVEAPIQILWPAI